MKVLACDGRVAFLPVHGQPRSRRTAPPGCWALSISYESYCGETPQVTPQVNSVHLLQVFPGPILLCTIRLCQIGSPSQTSPGLASLRIDGLAALAAALPTPRSRLRSVKIKNWPSLSFSYFAFLLIKLSICGPRHLYQGWSTAMNMFHQRTCAANK